MANPSQYGSTLFLESLDARSAASAAKLQRLQFQKSSTAAGSHDEKWLQHLIMRHPSLLPIDQIEPALTPLIPICTELPVGSGFLDNLLATPNGDLVLIECKLWRNPEARREVVGQIIHYASEMATWSYEHLQKAISRTKPFDGTPGSARTLFEFVSAKGELDEPAFIDAVTRNLRRGRFLLMIVGDGIREGVETMAEFLQQYAGIRFSLALVEMALYKLPAHGFIAQPRVLVKTVTVETRIVTVGEASNTLGVPANATVSTPAPKRTTISEERYFELLEQHRPGVAPHLKAFLQAVDTLHVSPEFGTDALILRWHPSSGKSWNLAAISSKGQVWLDWMGMQANTLGLLEEQRTYTEKLANLAGGVVRTTKGSGCYLAASNSGTTALTVDRLVSDPQRREGWVAAIQDFQEAVAERSQEE